MLLLAFQVKIDNLWEFLMHQYLLLLKPRPICFIQRNLNFQPFSDQNSPQLLPNTEFLREKN